mgnify:CR=1 FL=1
MNMAYRWFLGIPINEFIPHFSTVSHNFKHRFSQKTIEYVFRWILNTAAEEGYLDTEAVFVDGTHIKASANTKKKAKKMVPKQTKRYAKELLAEVNKDREEHGKKLSTMTTMSRRKKRKQPFLPQILKVDSSTKANTRNVLPMKPIPYAITITSSSMLSSQQEISTTALLSILCMTSYASITQTTKSSSQTVPTKPHGSAEGSLPVGGVLSTAYTRPKGKKDGHPWHEYVYDSYYDDVICPEYKALHYATTNRDGYREYKSRRYICADCPTREQCTSNVKNEKIVTRHIWSDYVEMAEDARHTPKYKNLYKKRQEKIERVFADAKESMACGIHGTEAWPGNKMGEA